MTPGSDVSSAVLTVESQCTCMLFDISIATGLGIEYIVIRGVNLPALQATGGLLS